jgi:hypothetical protein
MKKTEISVLRLPRNGKHLNALIKSALPLSYLDVVLFKIQLALDINRK